MALARALAGGFAVPLAPADQSWKWRRDGAGIDGGSKVAREIDFVVNKRGERVYIQSAFALASEEKKAAELKPFSLTGDSFRKIIVRNDVGLRWYDENGMLNVNLLDFLLDGTII